MHADTLLNGILALLVAQRDGHTTRSTESILADAGLTDEHITMLTGRDPARLQQPPSTAFGHSVIDRARAAKLERRH
jgi:hypothetical protein